MSGDRRRRAPLVGTRVLLILPISIAAAGSAVDMDPLTYPSARRATQTDEYHGTTVADPYRWLEQIDSAETRQWVAEESRLSRDFLDSIPGREAITTVRTGYAAEK